MLQDWGQPHSFLWRTGRTGLIDYSRPAAEQVAFVQRLRAKYIQTNPSNLNLFLHHCREHRIAIPTVHSVWTLSEVVDPALRRLCREVLDVPIIDNYSSSETGYIALQCPAHEHLHVQSETMLVEVIDAGGQPCGPGETGRVLITPLHNFATPLLRYEIGDEAEVGAPCPCGRGLPVLTRIVGRVMDHLTLPDGRKRRTDFRQYEFSSIRAIREYQVVQRARDRIEFRMVVSRPLTEAEEQEVRGLALLEFGTEFAIDLTYHASLPRTAAGKLRPFLSELGEEQ
jgi:phenylacetate-CoA ligase